MGQANTHQATPRRRQTVHTRAYARKFPRIDGIKIAFTDDLNYDVAHGDTADKNYEGVRWREDVTEGS